MSAQYQQFAEWLKTPLGEALLNAERKKLKPFWEYLRGDCLYTLGLKEQLSLVEKTKIKKNIILAPNKQVIGKHDVAQGQESILSESIDDIFLPHVLEFIDNPYQILREVDLALRLDGHIIITGFNPWSLWGLRRLFSFKKKAPWGGKFRRASQIKDWLKVLNFQIIQCKYFMYRPPITNKKIFSVFKFLEFFGKYFLPLTGGIYILIARKKTFCVTPIKKQWKEVSRAMSKGMIEPATRAVRHE